MANESPKNESVVPAQSKQGSRFYASLDKHGFKMLVIFFIVLVVLCLMLTFLVGGVFHKKDVTNVQYQAIFFTTLITLFGILITGIFIFMTFRIEHGAKIEAREEARNVARERVDTFVLKAEQDIQVFKDQAIEHLKQAETAATKKIQSLDVQLKDHATEHLKQAEAVTTKKIQALDAQLKDQATKHLKQTEAAVTEKIQETKVQAIKEVTGKVAELMENALRQMRNR